MMRYDGITSTEYASALREMADFYEASPEMPTPTWSSHVALVYDREKFVAGVRLMAHGGLVEKRTDGDDDLGKNHHAIRRFGKLELDLEIPRNLICRKVRKLVEVDVFECPDSLLEDDAPQHLPRHGEDDTAPDSTS